MLDVVETELSGVLVIEPKVHRDSRGYFLETWREEVYAAAGLPARFVQDNLSYSIKGVLRGLHYQHPSGQGKLIAVLQGSAFDVAVDIRLGSPTFGQWVGVMLSEENRRQIYIPPGFAHGFVVIGEGALVSYKCTTAYDAASEGSIHWNDPDLGIAWPLDAPILSPKDQAAPRLSAVATHRLPRFEPERDGSEA
jgi:dTDP-4-dehydrorhamnose 3,5-epimerase